MTSDTTPLAVFAFSAGGDEGFGRLSRASALADALGVERHAVVRGADDAVELAVRFGWTVHRGPDVLGCLLPDVCIVDDGSLVDVSRWIRQARRLSVPVVTLHERRRVSSADLTVDGTFVAYEDTANRLSGPEFALLDWRVAARRAATDARDPRRVVVALGAGTPARGLAAEVAAAVLERVPSLRVDVAAGISPAEPLPALPEGARWIEAPHGLVPHLAAATAVVSSGGMTLAESCALGTPTVAVATSPQERSSVDVASRAGIAVRPAPSGATVAADDVARAVIDLLADAGAAKAIARAGRNAVDGRGASRVADRIRLLLATSAAKRWFHAA